MPKESTVVDRRALLNASVVTVLSIPLGILPVSVAVFAAGKSRLDPKNPLAESLAYTHEAAKSARASSFDNCRSCLHYQGGPDDAWGGCNIFSDNLVNAGGWCNAYSKRE